MPDPTEKPRRVAIAIAAHPDDIEFMMAGTLLLLREAGWEIHCLNLSSGNCGSVRLGAEETEAKRLAEAQEAAAILGATFHPPFSRDLEVFYDEVHLRRLASIVREVHPSIVPTLPKFAQSYPWIVPGTPKMLQTWSNATAQINFVIYFLKI